MEDFRQWAVGECVVNPKVLHVLTAVAFIVIAGFVILPFLPESVRPSVVEPVAEKEE